MKEIEYNGFYIHEYQWGDKETNYCISYNQAEPLIDEEEAGIFGLEKYQEILKSFGARQFEHTFKYDDEEEIVHDSYFDTIEQCKKVIDYLNEILDEE